MVQDSVLTSHMGLKWCKTQMVHDSCSHRTTCMIQGSHGACFVKMHKYAQFKCCVKLNWKPVQTPKQESDVFSCSSAS